MGYSYFLAAVMGWYLLIMSLFIFLRFDLMKQILSDLSNQKPLLFIVGIITLLMGLIVVFSHNIWVFAWPVAITILGWSILLGGIFRLFCMEQTIQMAAFYLKRPYAFRINGLVALLLGCFLLYHAFLN